MMYFPLVDFNSFFTFARQGAPRMATTAGGRNRFVNWLDQPGHDRDLIGGKAASLGRLASLGAPVPPALALTTRAYAEFAGANALPRSVADITPIELPTLRASIMTAPLPGSIAGAIAHVHEIFAMGREDVPSLAVRSSGTAEDSAAFSFAGLHDTVLDVRRAEDLERAIRQCWMSLWSDRAVAYRLERGMATDVSNIAVVIQELVRSDVSFVAFTSDPVTHASDQVVIDATWGLGESIVSGLVVPDHITIANDGDQPEYVIGEKHLMVIPGDESGGGTRTVPVPRSLRRQPVLSSSQACEIAQIARTVSRSLGFEADLEGGIASGVIHLFQARPITTLGSGPDILERAPGVEVGDRQPTAGAPIATASYLSMSQE